jgi:hypothetical protein
MKYFRRGQSGLFASATLGAHLIRGAVAFALLGWALLNHHAWPVLALTAGLGALLAFRGCPLCWSIGLAETLGQRKRQGQDVPPSTRTSASSPAAVKVTTRESLSRFAQPRETTCASKEAPKAPAR